MATLPDILEDQSRNIPGSVCNSRRSSLRLKIDVISELRIMEEEMMKQAVLQHILQSSGLSDDLPQVETSDECLEVMKIRLSKVNDLGLRVLQLEQSELNSIEILSNTTGHGEHLLSLLNNYEDKELSSVLQSLPGNSVFLFPLRLFTESHFIVGFSKSFTILTYD